ncbi:MAG: saccharopine dehydrogenase NADP-binding domain-containing protein [Gammaproteobacteria bacterium]|nr:saccharopine dehydrogenase NADP-binding domain-containing protein [Gammaproteobacteria bacterium]MDH5239778.1 saccharopine dehydrogenase NADP-binding domain-containing protein [Gammaproteobacteria bacterium]MDH5262578.1 saccharopine dehydrogenase NADP-binding domain-containing protein [Gammaproteobacteria bacterium]MDH5582294.1 saccharopine dehydrogenase NADP-binding domain-containing protein [Gammaproteobacteria bacterium]
MRVTVLGSGLVGGAIAKDLAMEKTGFVRAVDRSTEPLAKLRNLDRVEVVCQDISTEAGLKAVIDDADLVVSAVPGHMGYETLRRVIDAGKNAVDISFFAEDPFDLDALAIQRGVTAVVDCGVAPGLSNAIAGHVHSEMDRVDSFLCLVGGLPAVRSWPYEYKAVFSPIDVMAEFTRPARFVEHGELVVRPALSDVELIDFKGVGTLEAFNTDGLRSLARTLNIPFMKEKTLRYPGHANLARVFRDSGFFGTEPMDVDGTMVRPIDVTSRLLIEQWRMGADDADLTVMQVIMTGEHRGRHERRDFYLLDRFDATSGTTSMARTTGYTCAIVARQILTGMFKQKGICPPEYLGASPDCYAHLLSELGRRNIVVQEAATVLAGSTMQLETNQFQRKIA